MAHVVLFHHAHGLTEGVAAFADELGAHGHQVTVPDLYDGVTFATVEEGVAHAEQIGFGEIVARGRAAAEPLPADIAYAGFSLGALPAQALAQTRAGARAALLYHGGEPVDAFGAPWPDGVALQIHVMDGDEWVEMDVAEELARTVPGAELYVYPGSAHLFTDSSLDDYDHDAAHLVLERTLALLSRLR
ncbi:MAG: dienelactone hydrolase family protein [Actinomycetota bacterium]|nr:dienelactone hydrolase family protein [Actinomycetota bacterium]